MRGRHVFELIGPCGRIRLHDLSKGVFVRDRLDGSRAVCARHHQPLYGRELLHELRRRQVSGRIRRNSVQAVRDRFVLSDRSVRTAAMCSRQLQLPHGSVERRAVHELDAGQLRPDRLEQLDALCGRHV